MGVFVGAWGACVAYCLYCKVRLFPLFDKNGGTLPCPEIRLSPARVAGESPLKRVYIEAFADLDSLHASYVGVKATVLGVLTFLQLSRCSAPSPAPTRTFTGSSRKPIATCNSAATRADNARSVIMTGFFGVGAFSLFQVSLPWHPPVPG